jgi:hypothetical protein
MEKMQEFIDFIFYEVWCKAPIGLAFSPDLFEGEPDLAEVLSVFGFSAKAPARGKEFYAEIKGLYELFATLSPPQIAQLRQWYQSNNNIEMICANDPAVLIARYSDLSAINPSLSGKLAAFFKDLYSQKLLGLSALRAKIGQIDEHYDAFMQANATGKCPFCGISDMLGIYHSKREAYDHFLPKGLYPFNSINFRNLVPACHCCNSSYKTTIDPSYSPKDPAGTALRRRSFYPYSANAYTIDIEIQLTTPDIDRLTTADIRLAFGPASVHEEIETWKAVYGVEERYKAKFCADNGGKYWLAQVLDECQSYDKQPDDILAMRRQQAQRWPYADCNFLNVAFLEACKDKGIFDS